MGVRTMIKACRKLRQAEIAAHARHELDECDQNRRELQEFVVLFNYDATEEAYEHLRACGFKTVEPARFASRTATRAAGKPKRD